MLDNKIGRFYRPTKSADFFFNDRFWSGDFYGQLKWANFIDRLSSA